MDAMYLRSGFQMAGLALVFACGLTGCSALSQKGNKALTAEVTPAGGESAATSPTIEAKYSVEFHYDKNKKKPEALERALTGTLHVQEALEQTGSFKKFRRCEIAIVRRLPNGSGHRIPVEYDRPAGRVNPEFDYAMLAGDRLIVTEDPTTVIDDMIANSWISPLAAKTNRRSSSGLLGK